MVSNEKIKKNKIINEQEWMCIKMKLKQTADCSVINTAELIFRCIKNNIEDCFVNK